jgi:hypothetical protein
MPITNVRGRQLKDDDVMRADLNTSVVGSAVIRRVIQGTGVAFNSTGVDTGTGDVTISLSTSGVTAGSYGSSTVIPIITVDTFGRITNVNTATVSGGGGGGGSSVRCEQTITATAGQTVFSGLTCTLTAGYFDVFVNGVKVNTASFSNTTNSITFIDGLAVGDIVDVVNYGIFTTSVVTANGFSGSVANSTTTPAITLSTSITGILKGSGGSLVAAVAGTDYQVPITLTTTGTSGAATFNPTTGALNIPNYATGAGAGTVTSVALSMPAIFTVSGSPITASGTLTATLATQTANTIFAGPNTGVAAAPTFRAIVAADIPTLNQNTTGSAATLTTARTITIGSTGKTFNGSADVSWTLAEIGAYSSTNPSGYTNNTGTVTSVAALTIGTTGTDIASSVANGTTAAVITLNVPTASATNRGALSSTDWSTFNGKQAALNGTGFVKISGTTISYDNSTYYLASNPSGYTNNTGTVTSVSVVTANGVSGSVTATATPAITITLGAITPTSVNSVVISGSTTPTLAVTGTSSISGSNTGDNAANSLYSGLVSNATHTGDATGSTALTVVRLRGVDLPALGASAGFLRYTGTGTNTWVFDSSTYLTANQSISVTGDATGSGSTSIALTLATVNSNTGTFNNVTVNAKGLVTAASNVAYITANQSITLSGDISGTGTTAITTTIGANKVTNAMLAQIPTATFHGRVTSATGNVENITGTQATTLLDVFSSTLKGLAPASGGGTTNFLRADGTWTTPGGGGSVTSVSVVTANGISGTVATATSTPAITLSLGAITPTSVNGLTLTAAATGFTIAGGTTSKTLTVSNTLTLSGTDASTLNIGAGGTLGSAAFTASTAYQATSTNLTSLAGLTFASTSFVKMTAAGTFALDTNTYYLSSNPSGYTNNTGTVTTVSVTTANGISGTVATAGTTPAITLSLGAITPSTVNGLTFSAAATGFTIAGGTTSKTLTVSNTLTLAGTDSSTLNIGSGGTLGTAAFTAATAYQASNTNLTSLAGLTFASTSFVKMTAAGTFALDTNTYYLSSNPSGYTNNTGTVTSVGGTGTVSGLTLTGTVTTTGSLTLGGTLAVTASNFSSQTANTFLAAPNGSAGVPTFRTIVAADIPTLNQSTTGSAGSVANSFIVRADSGTTEGTDIYTFNGSAGKNLNIVAGTNVTITKVAGQWTIAATGGGGSGTVTSVGLSLPAIFAVTGSPVTTSGTLTATLASQTINTVFAAPFDANGVPTFRTLAPADIPNLDAGKIVTGQLPVNRGGTGSATITGVLIGNGVTSFTGVEGTTSQLFRRNGGNTGYEFFTHTFASTTGATYTGQIISTLANSTTTGGAQVYLNGTTGNRIDFNTNGTADPAFTTRSVGTKIVLRPTLTGSTLDYAIGIGALGQSMWVSLPTTTSTHSFRVIAGTVSSSVFAIRGDGQTYALNFEAENNHATLAFKARIGATIEAYNGDDTAYVAANVTGGTGAAIYQWFHSPSTRNAIWSWSANTADRTYTLPNATGIIPISVNGQIADAAGNITISTGSGGGYTVTSQTANYTETATSGTKIIKCDTTSAAFTITLPTAVGNQATLIIKKTAAANALTIDGAGSETIDGGLTATLNKLDESITLVSDNTNWLII